MRNLAMIMLLIALSGLMIELTGFHWTLTVVTNATRPAPAVDHGRDGIFSA